MLRRSYSTTLEEVDVLLDIIGLAVENKKEFEPDIHPASLTKYQFTQRAFIDYLADKALDYLNAPEDLESRVFYKDCIYEHFDRKIITKKHLQELLISCKNNDIIKQAE